MSHPEIIDNCKKITVEYLLNSIGKSNIVSIILYGSVARNEESYMNVDGKLFLESDVDVLVVVKNRLNALKCLIRNKRLSENLSNELKKNWLLSSVNLSVTTENRLLNARPNVFYLSLKLNGKVIYGKELIRMIQSYGYDQYKSIPVDTLSRMIFGHMISVVTSLASSGIIVGNITIDGYNSILKSIRKLTLFMLRAIIIKNSIPVNPYSISEIRAKCNLYKGKNSICNDLLMSYEKISLSDSKEDCSLSELEKYMVTVISQFNSTLAILTGINFPNVDLRKEVVFSHFPFIRRLEYSAYIFLLNLETRWTIGLFKFIILVIYGPESIYLQYYHLFASGSNLISSTEYKKGKIIQQRRSWLESYQKSLQPWKYDKAGG